MEYFDWKFYLDYYKDLEQNGINNEEKAYNHWIKTGKKEGRIYNEKLRDFDWAFYLLYYEDLIPNGIDTQNKAYEHWMNVGYDEKRVANMDDISFKEFDWKFYINHYSDLKENGIDTRFKAFKHWLKYGKNENRLINSSYIINEGFNVKNHININYGNGNKNGYGSENENENENENQNQDIGDCDEKNVKLLNLFKNINLYVCDNNKFISNDSFKFVNSFKYTNKTTDKLLNSIEIIKNAYETEYENIMIINNQFLSFDYLTCQLNKDNFNIYETLNDGKIYDIIDLTIICDEDKFYNLIENKITIDVCDKPLLDAYFISKKGLKKILENYKNNKSNLLKDCFIGQVTRPLFKYNECENNNMGILSSTLWDTYFRVTSYWNKVYCFNLGFDIEKRNSMKVRCNLLNEKEDNFFYDGLLGLNIPDINTLVNMGIYNCSVLNYPNLKVGTFGLNIQQHKVIKEALENNYEYVLILEDDIYFNTRYFKVLDLIFDRYKNIDILYFGFLDYEKDSSLLFDNIDEIYGYSILKPKNDLLQKIKIGGFFSVLMSRKALEIYISRFDPIDNVSDILLCDIAFDIKHDFSNKKKIKTTNNLNVLFINHLFKMDVSKPSLTEENNFNMIDNFNTNENMQFLRKLKRLQFKVLRGYRVKIYISNKFKLYYSKLVEIILSKFNSYMIVHFIDESTDIVLYTVLDEELTLLLDESNKSNKINKNNINICINGENRKCNVGTDVGILTTKEFFNGYNIYFPQMFSSLWERKNDYIWKMNMEYNMKRKSKFCAYMYSYDVPYRVEIYNFISKYKKVDALGKSCSNIVDDDRFVYNENETYNDIAVARYSDYKFVLALENSICKGYMTEKLINPILAGSIPIYAGPNDIFDIINKKRIIYVYDFKNYGDLLEYIKKVDTDESLHQLIIKENIFVKESQINFGNFEEYIGSKINKLFGFEEKNIYVNNRNDKNIDIYNDKIDYIINSFCVPYNGSKVVKRYLSDYINKNDNIIPCLDSDLKKINYVSEIVWINLDRSMERRDHMENLFRNLAIKNTRISAIDGKREDVRNMIKNVEINEEMSNYEIACTLSHIKAINYLSRISGDYFMVCEDDISFDNVGLFNIDLKKIIIDAPSDFDILLINKLCLFELDDTYVLWQDYFDQGIDKYIYGTGCYIISRSGINKIMEQFESEFIWKSRMELKVADIYLYENLNTYVYKYNFVNLLNENSTIHNDHVGFQQNCCRNQTNIIINDKP